MHAVTSGTYEGKPFGGKLVLDVAHFDPASDLLYVNAATTLIAQYRDRHSAVSLVEATERSGFETEKIAYLSH